MYTSINLKTAKALKEAVKAGQKITIYAPGLGTPKTDGTEFLEGPWFQEADKWYAQATMKDGFTVAVK
jgi:hypothetical protein